MKFSERQIWHNVIREVYGKDHTIASSLEAHIAQVRFLAKRKEQSPMHKKARKACEMYQVRKVLRRLCE